MTLMSSGVVTKVPIFKAWPRGYTAMWTNMRCGAAQIGRTFVVNDEDYSVRVLDVAR
jgi:hypothetical protein